MSSAHLSDLSFSCLQRILRNEPLILLWKNQHKYYTNVDVVKTSVDRMRKIAITALNLIKRISTSLSHRFYHTTLTSFPSTITSSAQIAGFCIEQICFPPKWKRKKMGSYLWYIIIDSDWPLLRYTCLFCRLRCMKSDMRVMRSSYVDTSFSDVMCRCCSNTDQAFCFLLSYST